MFNARQKLELTIFAHARGRPLGRIVKGKELRVKDKEGISSGR